MASSTAKAEEVAPHRLKARLESEGMTLLDVREADEFRRERIDGAVLHPISQLDVEKVRAMEAPVVVTCLSGGRASRAAEQLRAAGVEPVELLAGGLNGWKKAGLPTIKDRKAPIPVMRQMQITAGALILTGTLLGAFVAPGWLFLSGFVGAGLMFAGFSGFCGMVKVLEVMPWNRSS